MRAFPFLGQRPALAVAGGPDEILDGFLEAHRAAFDEDETSVRAGEENEPGIEGALGHDLPPAIMRSRAAPSGVAGRPCGSRSTARRKTSSGQPNCSARLAATAESRALASLCEPGL